MTHSFPTRRSSDMCEDLTIWLPLVEVFDGKAFVDEIEHYSYYDELPFGDDAYVMPYFSRVVRFGEKLLKVQTPPSYHSRLTNKATYDRSAEHTSELQSLMRISYAVFCLKKK